MAQDTVYAGAGPNAAHFYHGLKLLDAVGATGSSDWVDLQGFPSGSLHLTGTFVGSVELHLSNAATKPAAATDGFVVQTLDQNTVMGGYRMPARWGKVKYTHTSGSVTAILFQSTVAW